MKINDSVLLPFLPSNDVLNFAVCFLAASFSAAAFSEAAFSQQPFLQLLSYLYYELPDMSLEI